MHRLLLQLHPMLKQLNGMDTTASDIGSPSLIPPNRSVTSESTPEEQTFNSQPAMQLQAVAVDDNQQEDPLPPYQQQHPLSTSPTIQVH